MVVGWPKNLLGSSPNLAAHSGYALYFREDSEQLHCLHRGHFNDAFAVATLNGRYAECRAAACGEVDRRFGPIAVVFPLIGSGA